VHELDETERNDDDVLESTDNPEEE
jgi:hypothetical protein